jgi:hypothetical protein
MAKAWVQVNGAESFGIARLGGELSHRAAIPLRPSLRVIMAFAASGLARL